MKKGVLVIDQPKSCALCPFVEMGKTYMNCYALESEENTPDDVDIREDCPIVTIPEDMFSKDWRWFNHWIHLIVNDVKLREVNQFLKEDLGEGLTEIKDDGDTFVVKLRKYLTVNGEERPLIVKMKESVYQVILDRYWESDGVEETECTRRDTLVKAVQRYMQLNEKK